MLSRYTTNLEIEKTDKGVQYYTTILPSPITPDAFQFKVVTQDGDRFDSLATRYYKDASKWWIIAKANGSRPDIRSQPKHDHRGDKP